MCDGEDDCGDGSDESVEHACKAVHVPCPEGQWECPGTHVTGVCVDIDKVCVLFSTAVFEIIIIKETIVIFIRYYIY